MSQFKVKVAQHANSSRWAVFIGDGAQWRVYHDSGVKSIAVHAARVLRSDAKRHPEMMQIEFDKAA